MILPHQRSYVFIEVKEGPRQAYDFVERHPGDIRQTQESWRTCESITQRSLPDLLIKRLITQNGIGPRFPVIGHAYDECFLVRYLAADIDM